MTVADRQAAYSGTKEVPENLAFDDSRLAQWLAPRMLVAPEAGGNGGTVGGGAGTEPSAVVW